MTLTEVVVAIGLLAAVGAPLISAMLTARRGVRSSLADVRASVYASRMAERLAAVPPARLPSPAPGLALPEREPPGVPRARWDEDLESPPGGVQLEDVVGATDPDGLELRLWFENLPLESGWELGAGELGARQVLVTVTYQATPSPDAPRRHLSVRTLAMEDP